jgi:hypothetical protein
MKSQLNLLAYVLLLSVLSLTSQSKLRSTQIKFATTSSKESTTGETNVHNTPPVQSNSNAWSASQMSVNSTEINRAETNSTQGDEEPKIHTGNCFMKMNNYFYNLYPLSKSDLIVKGKDGSFNNFNLCKNVETVCSDKKGIFVNKDTCSVYSNVWTEDKTWNLQCKI